MFWSTQKIADHLDLDYQGADIPISGCNTLEAAQKDEISFLANPKYHKLLHTTQAGAIVLSLEQAQDTELVGKNVFPSQNPYLDFVRIVQLFAPQQGTHQGHSAQAFIHPQAEVHPQAVIYPFVYIGPKVQIGRNTIVFAGCYVGEESKIGENCTLYPNVTLMARTKVGNNVLVHPGVVLGADGFGFAQAAAGLEKFPQVGRVVVEDDVEIGANTTIDRAALGETKIGQGTKIDNQVQIGHNVQIGKNTILVAQVGIAGSTTLGTNVILAGQVGVAGHLKIGDNCRVGAKSGVNRSLKPGTDVSGIPAMPHQKFLRSAALQSRLPELQKTIKHLEREIQELKKQLASEAKADHEPGKP